MTFNLFKFTFSKKYKPDEREWNDLLKYFTVCFVTLLIYYLVISGLDIANRITQINFSKYYVLLFSFCLFIMPIIALILNIKIYSYHFALGMLLGFNIPDLLFPTKYESEFLSFCIKDIYQLVIGIFCIISIYFIYVILANYFYKKHTKI